ncbi:MAG: DHH family phosphoesterase [Flavobacteriales bacterium]|nr:DHH family phosphoesterase [Flavobacteriales bacterium]
MHFPSAPEAQVASLHALLSSPRNVAIVTHFNPDGDALGSSLGLWHVLKKLGHTAHVVLPNTAPLDLHWMPGYSEAIAWDTARSESERIVCESEILFCLDFNKPDRASGLESAVRAAKTKVLVDHHRNPDDFAQVAFSDITACATAQMVFDILGALGHMDLIDKNAATCLYTGLMTDSGSFRFPSTTPHTLHVAAELMAHGAVPERIYEAIMDNNTEDRLRLLGYALQERMEVMPDKRTALIVLTKEDLGRFNFQPGDTEGLVNYGLSIRGNRLAAFIVERPDVVKLSLRSKGNLPVNEFLASHFTGGGHANAAGGHAQWPLARVVEKFKQELPAFLAKYPG